MERLPLLCATVVLVCIASGWAAEPPNITDPKDRRIVEAFCRHARAEARKITVESLRKQPMPEMYCWLELKWLNLSLTAYELSGDANHLSDFAAGWENMRKILAKDDKGFLGWRGIAIKPHQDPADPNKVIDDIQTSFRAVAVASRFCELLDREPELAKRYAELRKASLDLMENHLVAKWHARGCFVDLGAGGAVYRNNPAYRPARMGIITLSYEKLSIMVDGLLNLYRVTRKPAYLERAVKIGTRLKRCLSLADGRYSWHYWDPAGAWDADPNADKWLHWIGPEPRGEWHAVTVGIMTRLYHLGVVFDKSDIERLVKTQREVCWNGDMADPVFRCTNGKPPQGKQVMMAPSLAPFDGRIAEFLLTGPRQDERLAQAGSSWRGGMLAEPYLRMKYLVLPRVRNGKPTHLDATKAFRADPKGKAFLESLAFEVTAPGYQAPYTPSQMRDN